MWDLPRKDKQNDYWAMDKKLFKAHKNRADFLQFG